MTDLIIRPARLDDTERISALFRSRIPIWQRLTAHGQVENLPYARLTLAERWSHGGAWMSVETAALHLSRLLRGAGMALLAERGGEPDPELVGYAEIYPGDEPAPFGEHLHLVHLLSSADDPEVVNTLLRYLLDLAKTSGSGQLTVSLAGDPAASPYRAYRLERLAEVQRYQLPARTGQGFYKVSEYGGFPQVDGWLMSVGRTESARYHLEMLWNRVWEILPEIAARKLHRLHISASGHEAYVCCQQQVYNPRSAELFCWSPKALTPPLLTALRDWAHRQEYRTLTLTVTPETVKLAGNEAEPEPFIRRSYAIRL